MGVEKEGRLSEDDPNVLLHNTLRGQIDDLLQQVSQLNGKLVQSYDRVSDLEDTLHVTSTNLHKSNLQISELEIERAQHLSALNTGLLVEKATITAELTRLMERVTEETAQRGVAENAKQDIEKDLDDLSANLFLQANTMVAEARYARAMSERKADDAERALHDAEEAVSLMQTQMQALSEEKERAEAEAELIRQRMEKGKWVGDDTLTRHAVILAPRLSTAHLPYQEFLLFNSHLRSIRNPRDPPPSILTLIHLPFLARLQAEDSDPTLRLDFAPSLNFLTRRSVATAIHSGQLTIEPLPTAKLTSDPTLASSILASTLTGGPSSVYDLTCALCGKHIFPPLPGSNKSKAPTRGRLISQTSSSWATSTSRFFKSSNNPSSPSSPTTAAPSQLESQPLPAHTPPQIHVFRIALPPAPAPPTTPNNGSQKPSTTYPLCHAGFCVKRLRSTCELWRFVREGIVSGVWNEVLVDHPSSGLQPPQHPTRASSYSGSGYGSDAEKGTPRKSLGGVAGRVGGLWASLPSVSGAVSALGSRSTSPAPSSPTATTSGTTSVVEEGEKEKPPPPPARRLPPLLPILTSRNSVAETTSSTAAGPGPEAIETAEKTAPVPPLPPRRRPTAPVPPTTSEATPRTSTDSDSVPPPAPSTSDDTATVTDLTSEADKDEKEKSTRERPESGLLTPASESSGGFRTPPDQDPQEPVNADESVVVNGEHKAEEKEEGEPKVELGEKGPAIERSLTPTPPSAPVLPDTETTSTPVVVEAAPAAPAPAPPTVAAAAPPPPLPRRAAARAASGNATGPPSRVGSPAPVLAPAAPVAPVPTSGEGDGVVPAAETEKEVEKDEKEAEPAAAESPAEAVLSAEPEVKSSTESDTLKPADEDDELEPRTPTAPTHSHSLSHSSTSGGPPPPPPRRTERAYSVVSAVSEASHYSGTSNASGLTSPPPPHGFEPATPTATRHAPPPALPPRRSNTSVTVTNGKVNGVNGTNGTNVSSTGGTIGLADGDSWEERTWRELVRLREDLFWARMGRVGDAPPASTSDEVQG